MRTLGIGLGIAGLGMIAIAFVEFLKFGERMSKVIDTSGEPDDYSFEDEWDK